MNFFLFVFVLLICTTSCKTEKFKNGIIRDLGNPALDGCGWVIEIGSDMYSPTNLNDTYKENGLNVDVKFRELESQFQCGLQQQSYKEIEILEIGS